jgi:hypothetical protein
MKPIISNAGIYTISNASRLTAVSLEAMGRIKSLVYAFDKVCYR